MDKSVARPEHLLKNRMMNGVEIAKRFSHGINHEQRLTGGNVILKSVATNFKQSQVRDTVSAVATEEDNTPILTDTEDTPIKKIVGYALKYVIKSEPMQDEKHGKFYETISSSALQNTDLSNVVCLFNHDKNIVLSSTEKGNLKLIKDNIGLKFECSIDEDKYANILHDFVTDGIIDKCSFSFKVAENGDTWTYDENEKMYHREVTNIETIDDVSIVGNPAYKDTEVKATSLTNAQRKALLVDELKAMQPKEDNKKINSIGDAFMNLLKSGGNK